MQNPDIVEQFRKCWDLANELAEKETKECFGERSYLIETIQDGGHRKEPSRMRRIRVSKGEYKLERMNKHMVMMIDLFAIRYGRDNME